MRYYSPSGVVRACGWLVHALRESRSSVCEVAAWHELRALGEACESALEGAPLAFLLPSRSEGARSRHRSSAARGRRQALRLGEVELRRVGWEPPSFWNVLHRTVVVVLECVWACVCAWIVHVSLVQVLWMWLRIGGCIWAPHGPALVEARPLQHVGFSAPLLRSTGPMSVSVRSWVAYRSAGNAFGAASAAAWSAKEVGFAGVLGRTPCCRHRPGQPGRVDAM